MTFFILFIIAFIASLIGSSIPLVLYHFIAVRRQSKRESDQNIMTEESPEDHRLFDEDSKKIIEYCFNKGIPISIQPNYEGVLWIFHHDGSDLYAITEMIPGAFVQMVNKINTYWEHKEERQKEMKNARS